MGTIDYNQLSACVLEKHLFTNDRQCIVKDPTADLLEIVQVVDKKYQHVFDTTKIELKFDGKYYLWQIANQMRSDDCPPCERRELLRFAQQRVLMDHIVCFAYRCDRRAQKYKSDAAAAAADAADAAAAAADAADAAAYAAAYAAADADADADAAAAAAAAAAVYADAAAAAAVYADAAAAVYAAAAAADAAAYAAADADADADAAYAAADADADAAVAARHTEYEWQIAFLRRILAPFGVNEVI